MPHSTKENSLEDSSFLPEIDPAAEDFDSNATDDIKTEKPSVQPISQPPIDLSQNSKNKRSKMRKIKNVSKQENSKNDENQGGKKKTREKYKCKDIEFC